MNSTATSNLPPMVATVLHAGSAQGDLMRFGKEPKRPLLQADGTEAKQPLAVSTAIYDGLAVLYTEAEVGSMLVVNLPNRPTMGNLNRILRGRGLTPAMDYMAYRAKYDVDGNKYPIKDRPLVLEKLSPTAMKMSAGKVSYGREMASQARERGETDRALTHARQLGPKGRKGEMDAERERLAREGSATPLDDILGQAESPAPILPVNEQEKLEQAEIDALNSVTPPSLEIGG